MKNNNFKLLRSFKTKKLLSILLVPALSLNLYGCSDESSDSKETQVIEVEDNKDKETRERLKAEGLKNKKLRKRKALIVKNLLAML